MKMPSRQTLAKLIFLIFIVFFVLLIALYLYNPFSTNNDDNSDFLEDEKRGSIFAPFGSFFTGGNDDEINRPGIDDDPQNPDQQDNAEELDRLRQVTTSPTAAAIFYLDEEEIAQTENDLDSDEVNFEAYKKNTIRYVLKESGHVYETTSDSTNVSRVSITTIPKIAQAFFTGPLTLVYRYLDGENELKTFSAEIIDNPNGTEGQKVQGIFFPDNIVDLETNIGNTFLYSEKTTDGSNFVTTNYLGEDKTRVFTSPLSELRIDYKSKGGTAVIYTTPSANSYGRVFTLNTATGATNLVSSGKRALAALGNSNLSKIALSSKEGERHTLTIYDTETNEVFNTGLETFVDKCVWSLDNVNLYCGVPEETILENSPDTWYKGVNSYSDLLWVINTNTRAFELLMSPVELAEEEIDMIDVNLSTDEQFIHFINKNDLTLWSYKLN